MNRRFATIALLLAASLGCGGEPGKAKRAGQAVGETVTHFSRGVGSGVDKRLEVQVELLPSVVDLGLSKTVAKTAAIDAKQRGISVYLISEKPVTGSLVAKAVNAEGEEIGRSVVKVEFSADDAKYVTFAFGDEMDSQLVERYVIDAKAEPSAEP
jgi:hypothetical protein